MGPDDIADVASYLGVDAGEANKRVARLLCAGGKNEAARNSDYSGFENCKAAAAVASGGKACTWGCLGLADCEESCLLDAIYMNENELPVVIPELCTACNDCVIACPLDLFVLMPMDQKLIVQCKNLLHGDAAEDLCSVACNACMKCVADSEPGVIEIRNNLAVIDYEKNSLTDPKAISRCETGAIVWVEGQQFEESPARAGEKNRMKRGRKQQENQARYPGILKTGDGSSAVVAMETAASEAAGAYPITPSTQMGEGWASAVAAGQKMSMGAT